METHEDTLPFNDYGTWIRKRLGCRIQKLSVDAGFTCPNRDGLLSFQGCTFCDNATFTPSYCHRGDSIKQQLISGKTFYARKYPSMRYLAYFQSYSNTYAPLERLKRLYEEALNTEDVIGLVIGTRPDCLQPDILHYLECLSRQTFLVVELGIESTNNNTLLRVNRGHDYACSQQAVEALASRGIQTGGHIILGLPGEDKTEQLRQAHEISRLPLTLLKIHQLQIIKGTRMARDYEEGKIKSMEADEYLHILAHYISRLRENLVLERFFSASPLNKVVSPRWGLKPDILTQMLCQYMREQQLWQGKASII